MSGTLGEGEDGENEEEGGEAADVGEEVPGEEGPGDVAEQNSCGVQEGRETGQSSPVLGTHSLRYEDAHTGHGQAHSGAGDGPEDQHHGGAAHLPGQAQAEEGGEEEEAGGDDGRLPAQPPQEEEGEEAASDGSYGRGSHHPGDHVLAQLLAQLLLLLRHAGDGGAGPGPDQPHTQVGQGAADTDQHLFIYL